MNEARRRFHLQRMADYGDRHFDPAEGLLLLPMAGIRTLHTGPLDDTPRHPVRESLCYALVLLELAERSLQGRAESVIRRMLALQEAGDPGAKTGGLWPWFLEEPAPDWPRPDFNGMTLLLIWHRHGRRLSASLVGEIEQAILRVGARIRRHGVCTGPASLAIQGAFVMLSAAEMAEDADLFGCALARLERLRDAVLSAGGGIDYDSMVCAAASLAGLHAILTYVRDERARQAIFPLVAHFWGAVAGWLHPETPGWAETRARARTMPRGELPELLGALIEKASRGAVVYPQATGREAFGALHACVVNVDAPAGVAAALSAGVGSLALRAGR